MSDTINAIRGLLNLPRLHKFYAEAKLDDGRLIVTEAESMAIGVEIKVMNDAGEAADLEDGTYTLEDGTKISITEGRISELGGAEAEAPVEAQEEEVAMAEHEEDKMKALKEELQDVVDEATMNRILEKVEEMMKPEEEMEDEEKEMQEDEKVEMAHAFAEELKAFSDEVSQVFDVVLARIERLENAPASEGVSVSPTNFSREAEPKAINPRNRARQIIEAFKTN